MAINDNAESMPMMLDASDYGDSYSVLPKKIPTELAQLRALTTLRVGDTPWRSSRGHPKEQTTLHHRWICRVSILKPHRLKHSFESKMLAGMSQKISQACSESFQFLSLSTLLIQ